MLQRFIAITSLMLFSACGSNLSNDAQSARGSLSGSYQTPLQSTIPFRTVPETHAMPRLNTSPFGVVPRQDAPFFLEVPESVEQHLENMADSHRKHFSMANSCFVADQLLSEANASVGYFPTACDKVIAGVEPRFRFTVVFEGHFNAFGNSYLLKFKRMSVGRVRALGQRGQVFSGKATSSLYELVEFLGDHFAAVPEFEVDGTIKDIRYKR